MRITKKIGLIGCGNMGSAILQGVLKNQVCRGSNIWVADKMQGKAKDFCKKNKCRVAQNAAEAAQKAEIIFLAVKPQDFSETAAAIRPFLNSRKIVISILAGVQIAGLQKQLGSAVVVRAMPNLGAIVGASVTAVCSKNKSAVNFAKKLFEACGAVAVLNEKYFDAVTAVSGSGPAYFFLMMELLQAFAEANGIDTKSARALAVQTALGAGKLAAASAESPSILRERVTSKKGTTDAALTVLKYRKFPKTFFEALNAAVKRSRQLSGAK
ncbi:MAG TPA: pyrroline-5-carboxylate reductase [Candidatus Omnitrophica bacterium]|nr:pyrroline-5-carboxylate reductase [Candidatus Omnitrophota bacterium]